MNSIINFLSGKKTYIGIVVGAVYSILIALGVAPDSQIVWTIIVSWTGISFRLAVSK